MDRFVSGKDIDRKDIVKKTRPNGGKVVSSKVVSSKVVSSKVVSTKAVSSKAVSSKVNAHGHDDPLGFTKVKLTATQKRRALKPRKTPAKPALA